VQNKSTAGGGPLMAGGLCHGINGIMVNPALRGSERAKERKFQGANWPGSYWPIASQERIGPGAKRLGTISHTDCA